MSSVVYGVTFFPATWNFLPETMHDLSLTATAFDSRLKTELFASACGVQVSCIMRWAVVSVMNTFMSVCRQIVFAGVILSTDDFFVNHQGIYQHDSRLLQQAHMWNQQRGVPTKSLLWLLLTSLSSDALLLINNM